MAGHGLRVPLLQINTTTLFGTEVVTAVYYYDVPRSIQVVDPLANTSAPARGGCELILSGLPSTQGFLRASKPFTAQLSDATGSFAAPVDIGDVIATTSGTIISTIRQYTVGTGYRFA